ncbi:MAG: PEGA domain-containing protein [Candidatus Omnitrophica bacterium]|nr:PEGA domain-containing protein [Candidatus Omnitrophota bacterium]
MATENAAPLAWERLRCRPPTAYCLLGPALLLLTTGCIYRSLTIKTEPSGALVYMNDQLKGTSPVTYDFLWYGWHRITLRKEGFERVEDRKQLRAPIYLWIPLDLAMELLPVPIRDRRSWSYTLMRETIPPAPVPPEIATPPVVVTPTAQPAAPASPAPASTQPPGAPSTQEPPGSSPQASRDAARDDALDGASRTEQESRRPTPREATP